MPELLFLPLVLKLFYSSNIIKAYNFLFTQLGTSEKEVVGEAKVLTDGRRVRPPQAWSDAVGLEEALRDCPKCTS